MHALIVAHGQPSAPPVPEAALGALAARVRNHLPGWVVKSATMATPYLLEQRARDCPAGTLVYPLFMADGWFVRTKLRRRLNGFAVQFLDPMGLDPALPALAANLVQGHAASHGWDMGETTLLLPAHGSARSDLAADATRAFAQALQPLLPDTPIRLGFVEQPPSIEDAAHGLSEQAISLPFFAAKGGHALEDVPQALDAADFKGVRLPPLGLACGIPALIANALRRAV
ncbi:CbiX/SirB N-terminal domain-containing protein [Phaeobacter marinintestinus]|uniref:CbiX/SirB N-terminal domain-containing protein n=1 Tax=Falsiphaeobacter marinintestinus TaxID=1492905 RepID=UPI0011B6D8AA|nr:CbiX/SirB N-terminal domain-containing protein [Phaeobacter marinintestinus]